MKYVRFPAPIFLENNSFFSPTTLNPPLTTSHHVVISSLLIIKSSKLLSLTIIKICWFFNLIHNYITGFIVEVLPLNHDKLILTIDKSFRRDAINEFNNYVKDKIGWITLQRGITRPGLFSRNTREVTDFYYKLIESRKRVIKERF